MGELVRMPHATLMSPTEDVDPQHPQAQVLMMISGDVYMTMTPPPAAAGEDTEPSPTAELDIKISADQPEPFRRKDRRVDTPPPRWSLRSLLSFSRGRHRGPRKGPRA